MVNASYIHRREWDVRFVPKAGLSARASSDGEIVRPSYQRPLPVWESFRAMAPDLEPSGRIAIVLAKRRLRFSVRSNLRGWTMLLAAWKMLKDTVLSFIDDEALSRGAAIAFYTVTSIAPVLLIVIAIAGLVFGRDAAENAIIEQLSGLMGQQTAEVLQAAVANAASKTSGIWATIIGIATLIVTASG